MLHMRQTVRAISTIFVTKVRTWKSHSRSRIANLIVSQATSGQSKTIFAPQYRQFVLGFLSAQSTYPKDNRVDRIELIRNLFPQRAEFHSRYSFYILFRETPDVGKDGHRKTR